MAIANLGVYEKGKKSILAILTLSKLRFSDVALSLFISFHKCDTKISKHFTFHSPLQCWVFSVFSTITIQLRLWWNKCSRWWSRMKTILCAHSQTYFIATNLQSHAHISNLEDQWSNNVRNEMTRVFLRGLFATQTPKIKPTRAFCEKNVYKAVYFIVMKTNKLSQFRADYISHHNNSHLQVYATSKPVNPHINQSRNCNIVTWLYQLFTSLKSYTVLFCSTVETLACITVYFMC